MSYRAYLASLRVLNFAGQVVCLIVLGLATTAFVAATHQAIMAALGQ